MKADICTTEIYQDIEDLCRSLREPGTGQFSDAADVRACLDEQHVAFAGAILDRLEATLATRVCATDLTTGKAQVTIFGPNCDHAPRFSSDGRHLAPEAGHGIYKYSALIDHLARVVGWFEQHAGVDS